MALHRRSEQCVPDDKSSEEGVEGWDRKDRTGAEENE